MGGAKKSFSTDSITLEESSLTINELIDYLIQIKPKNSLEFDTKNLLIAVNGIDSSALQGYDTRLNDNDIVSIIPIIHGGVDSRIQFSVMRSNVEIFPMLNDKKTHSLDDSINLSVYKPGLKTTKVIKERIKNISKIIKELKNLKNG